MENASASRRPRSSSTTYHHFYTSCVITVILGIWLISGIIIVVTEANPQYPPEPQEHRITELDRMLMAEGHPRQHFVDTGGKTRNLVGMW
jgi:hypothetical protein